MRMREAGPPPGERWTAYLSVLVAACSLGLGGLCIVVLLKARSLPADAPRPYLYSERDRDAEKVVQRHNLTEWEILKQSAGPTADARPRHDSVLLAATISLLKEEQIEESKGPRTEQHADNRRPTSPPTLPAKPNLLAKPSPPPNSAKPMTANDEVLRTYVTDGIADIRVDVKGMASRMAVAEADLKRMQEAKSLFEWFALVVACLAAIQGIAVLLLPFVARRRKLDIVQKQEAPPTG